MSVDGNEESKHDCACIWLSCHHITTSCKVIATVELFICVCFLISGIYIVAAGAASYGVLPTWFEYIQLLYHVAFATSCVLIFVAISRIRPEYVLPHVVMQITGQILGPARVGAIIHLASVGDLPSQLEAKNGKEDPVAKAGVSLAAVASLVAVGVHVWLMLLFMQLKRYLVDQKAYRKKESIVNAAHEP